MVAEVSVLKGAFKAGKSWSRGGRNIKYIQKWNEVFDVTAIYDVVISNVQAAIFLSMQSKRNRYSFQPTDSDGVKKALFEAFHLVGTFEIQGPLERWTRIHLTLIKFMRRRSIDRQQGDWRFKALSSSVALTPVPTIHPARESMSDVWGIEWQLNKRVSIPPSVLGYLEGSHQMQRLLESVAYPVRFHPLEGTSLIADDIKPLLTNLKS